MQKQFPLSVFIGGILFFISCQFYLGVGTWDLNRTTGWGWDFPPFISWTWSQSLWGLVFPITYWYLLRRGYTLNKGLAAIQLLGIALLLIVSFLAQYGYNDLIANLLDYLLYFLWLVFALLVIVAIAGGKETAF